MQTNKFENRTNPTNYVENVIDTNERPKYTTHNTSYVEQGTMHDSREGYTNRKPYNTQKNRFDNRTQTTNSVENITAVGERHQFKNRHLTNMQTNRFDNTTSTGERQYYSNRKEGGYGSKNKYDSYDKYGNKSASHTVENNDGKTDS
jgi:hypothetical protein